MKRKWRIGLTMVCKLLRLLRLLIMSLSSIVAWKIMQDEFN